MEQHQLHAYGHVARQLVGDVTAGGISGLLVSPAITIMDRAIVEQAATGQSLLRGLTNHGLSALKNPIRFFSSAPLKIIFTLYATTYVVANGSETVCSEFTSAGRASPIVFISTFAFNVPLGIWKDVQFSRFFGGGVGQAAEAAKLAKGAGPKAATAAFLVRDAITIYGSFSLPGFVSDLIPSSAFPDPSVRSALSQLAVPVLSQVAATPVHIIGLDHYSRQDGAGLVQRASRTAAYLPSTTVARCMRIVPAFGFGVLANRGLRNSLHEKLGSN